MNGLRKCVIYTTMEFYSAAKKNKILSFAREWMKLENIILSKVSQAQKAKNSMFSLICEFRPKTNAVILLYMGHTLRGETHRERERNQILNVNVLTLEQQI
jgi:hypothetical protein